MLYDLSERVRIGRQTRVIWRCFAGSTFIAWDVFPHRLRRNECRVHLPTRRVGGRRNGRLTRENPAFTTCWCGELRRSGISDEFATRSVCRLPGLNRLVLRGVELPGRLVIAQGPCHRLKGPDFTV